MTIGRGAPSSLAREARTTEWFARMRGHAKRRKLRRQLRATMFRELGCLYGHQWELAEARFIREECEAVGIPMGYGRVGQKPRQLTWSAARAAVIRVDWSGVELEHGEE
jgi:hypothetical protein